MYTQIVRCWFILGAAKVQGPISCAEHSRSCSGPAFTTTVISTLRTFPRPATKQTAHRVLFRYKTPNSPQKLGGKSSPVLALTRPTWWPCLLTSRKRKVVAPCTLCHHIPHLAQQVPTYSRNHQLGSLKSSRDLTFSHQLSLHPRCINFFTSYRFLTPCA